MNKLDPSSVIAIPRMSIAIPRMSEDMNKLDPPNVIRVVTSHAANLI